MARATKILNKYEIKLLALSDIDINYDNFYKEELIAFCKCLKEEYKKQKEAIDKAIKSLEIQVEVIKEQPSDSYLDDDFEIKQRLTILNVLKEVE
jgi:hypothetical protein